MKFYQRVKESFEKLFKQYLLGFISGLCLITWVLLRSNWDTTNELVKLFQNISLSYFCVVLGHLSQLFLDHVSQFYLQVKHQLEKKFKLKRTLNYAPFEIISSIMLLIFLCNVFLAQNHRLTHLQDKIAFLLSLFGVIFSLLLTHKSLVAASHHLLEETPNVPHLNRSENSLLIFYVLSLYIYVIFLFFEIHSSSAYHHDFLRLTALLRDLLTTRPGQRIIETALFANPTATFILGMFLKNNAGSLSNVLEGMMGSLLKIFTSTISGLLRIALFVWWALLFLATRIERQIFPNC